MKSHAVPIAYLVAALMVAFPLLDLGANLWPWAVGEVGWRYGSYGLVSGFLLTPLMGGALALGTALVAGHARTARVLGAAGWVVAAVLMLSTAAFVLDALQVRSTVPAEARVQFAIGTLKAAAKNGIAGLCCLWLGRIGWRAGASRRSARGTASARVLMSARRSPVRQRG